MSKPVEDWELSAFVDGDLPSRRMEEIEAEAERSPGVRQHLRELLADHQALMELARLESASMEGLPPRLADAGSELAVELSASVSQSNRARLGIIGQVWRQIVVLTAGVAVGWAAASWAAASDDTLSAFIDEAAEVHRVSAVAPFFAREASDTAIHSIETLFAHKLTPPDLTAVGFTLSRIDVVATDTGPAALFVYTDPEARRLSLVLSLDSPILEALDRDGSVPRVTTHDGLAFSYGHANDVAYALVGSIPEPRARQIAGLVATSLTQ
jgi:anti-sigma factor RsiW